MGYDPDACILCARCVRYTQEVMQCSALSLEGRGGESRIVPTWGKSWLDTECELCGGCLSVCPTGAIYEKFVEGAPPAHEERLVKTKTTCTFCGVGCQIDLNVDPETKRIVKVTSDPSYVSNDGNLCVKGRFAFNFVHHPDRLTTPLIRGEDGRAPRGVVGRRARRGRCRAPAREGAARRAVDRLSLVGAARPTRSATSPRSWRGRWSAPTPSTPAKRPDTLRPFTAWSGRSAEEQAPTRSRRSRTTASCS